MNAVKKILVPVDFSDLAAASYHYALHLADELSAAIHLLYSKPSVRGATTHPEIFQEMNGELFRRAEERLELFREEGIAVTRADLKNLPTVTRAVSILNFKDSIRQESEEHKVDLILIGTHGIHDNWDRLFGTNAASLVGKIETPILIIPNGAEFQPFKSICFATDFGDHDIKKATYLHKVFYPFLPRMYFLHVQNPGAPEPPEGIDFFRHAYERPRQVMEATFTVVNNEDVTDGIFGYLQTQPHDLLVMVKPNRGWWSRLLSHSETRETAGITNIPLLILGERDWEIQD
ncbi:universal stress protein [Neolewinella persica]|uniref:universal stress protein n=1 Tax=Neolewinella persica TaxID=70998 RepID=UPI0003605FE3|nr:universal stress protein [Neolewinella persica]